MLSNIISCAGANLGWPTEFGLNVNLTCKDDAITSDIWIFSFVNASTYLTAALLGCWLSDPLNEHVYGRKGALFVAGIFSFASVIGAAYTTNWRLLLACRILLGLGMGAKVSVVAVYMSEAAPTIIRGRVVVLWQTFVAFGIFLGNAANIVVRNSWRWQLACSCFPALLLLVLVPLSYE